MSLHHCPFYPYSNIFFQIWETWLWCCRRRHGKYSFVRFDEKSNYRFNFFSKRFPFNWKNPIAYLFVVVFEYISSVAMLFVAATLVSYAIRFYLWLLSMTADINCDLESINKNAGIKKLRCKIVKQFSELIEFHSKVLQLSRLFSCLLDHYKIS